MQRNICPICGSENPEGSEFCQVCKANLSALPKEIYPAESDDKVPALPVESQEKSVENDELDLDSPIPVWMKSKLNTTEKKPLDFDAYTDILFGVPDNHRTVSPNKFSKTAKAKREEKIYQPQFQGIVEPPLIEPDENSAKSIEEEIPGIADFRIQRPAKKWEDQRPETVSAAYKGTSVSLLDDFKTHRPARKWEDTSAADSPNQEKSTDSQNVMQLPLWWQQDAPLVETENDSDFSKNAVYEDDPALETSASPTKVVDAAEIFGNDAAAFGREDFRSPVSNIPVSDAYEPERGSLVSDLMNEINRNSGSLSPSEQAENRSGTLFYSGNHPAEESSEDLNENLTDISLSDDDSSSAEMLDRILRNIGYEVEGEPQSTDKHTDKQKEALPAASVSEDDPDEKINTSADSDQNKKNRLIHAFYIPQVIDNPLIPDDDEDGLSVKDVDPYDLLGESIPEKEDITDEQEIPWDLFGTADMTIPQSPEDPAYQTFSRGILPDDPGSTDYQQRMISSILGKIIQAENFVQPQKVKNNREISIIARIFWAALAIAGVIAILQTNLTEDVRLPSIPAESESADFFAQAEGVEGNSLIIIDYTPAYTSEMNAASEALINDLTAKTGKVYLAVLNPAAMPSAQQFLDRFGEKVEFSGWWPAGVVSLRSRISSGSIPENIWLLTAENTSARMWAEQLSVSADDYNLHIMAPGQLEPLLKPYLRSSMISSMLSRDIDLMDYGKTDHSVSRNQMAVWYLCVLLPLAWLSGTIIKFMKSEPDYHKKVKRTPDMSAAFLESEAEKEQQNG